MAVANVSVNRMNLVIDGKPRTAFQIGTVMTSPDVTGRGLAKDLMCRALADCGKQCGLVYLVANREVAGFYPKFGFKPVAQSGYSHSLSEPATTKGEGRFLNVLDKSDTDLIIGLNDRRSPVSNVCGVTGAEHILMFYAYHGFDKCIYFVETKRTMVVYRQKGGTVHVYDVIAPVMPVLSDVLKTIPLRQADKVNFHFTPDLMGVPADKGPLGEADTLFMREDGAFPSGDFRHPALAQA